MRKRINLTLTQFFLNTAIDFGKEHGFENRPTTIITSTFKFIMRLWRSDDVQVMIQTERIPFLHIVERLVREYTRQKGYSKPTPPTFRRKTPL